MSDKLYPCFVDGECPRCDGNGFVTRFKRHGRHKKGLCPRCHGTGISGGVVMLPEPEINTEKNEFGMKLRAIRENAKVSMHELARFLGARVTRVSDIERGTGQPVSAQEKEILMKWMEKVGQYVI